MTRIEALTALLEKVEAGEAPSYQNWRDAFDHLVTNRPHEHFYPILRDKARESFLGSLDAAKALHDAVFGDWGYSYYSDDGHFLLGHPTDVDFYTETHQNCQARAWLIAILKALIAMEAE